MIFELLHAKAAGLSVEEAARRLQDEGPNVLPEKQPDTVAEIFLRQFKSPLIYILLAAAVTVFLLGETADGAIILAVLLFNAIIGSIQEGRAQNTLSALKQYVNTTATVVRDETEMVIPDREVVRGDILSLREGEKVPADARVLVSNDLRTDEAALTGESVPAHKTAEAAEADGPDADRRNMVFKGTTVVAGNGRAVVVETGLGTAIGSIARTISSIDTEMPLRANIRHLSRVIIVVVAAISGALFALGLARGESVVTIFSTVVSLAVSIIPEGLPIVITLVLATGVWRMSKRNALVKKLQAVEALGQARVIAVDKTGTITKNELTVSEVWTDGKLFSIGGIGYEPKGAISLAGSVINAANHPELLLLGKLATLGSSGRVYFSEKENRWRIAGDPTEAAIQVFGEKAGFKRSEMLSESPLVSEIPFDYKLKYRAVVFKAAERNTLIVSGAPEAVLALSTKTLVAGAPETFSREARESAQKMLATMSAGGLRVVALAMREGFTGPLAPEAMHGLVFVGFLGMLDELRPEVADAMKKAALAGVRVVMITGDHELTARAIAKEAGIAKEGDELLTGSEIDEMSDAELTARIATASVFARVTPEHKLRIINAYKKRGEIVAMTGDGVNDAPPLVAADLGVAMGKIGTEVAKEAADIVLLDDNFGSILSAIEEGRNIYATIKKVVLYLFSTSLGEVATITGALLLGYPLPLLATQIIWLNFITDGFLVVALAMEPKDGGLLLKTFKRPGRYLIDSLMLWRMGFMALPMMAGTLFLFDGYAGADLAKGWTLSLTTLAVFQWFNAWNCRSAHASLFRTNPFNNAYLVMATLTVVALQLAAVYTPFFQKILRTVPLDFSEWLAIIAIASSIVIVEEFRKLAYRKRHRKTPSATALRARVA